MGSWYGLAWGCYICKANEVSGFGVFPEGNIVGVAFCLAGMLDGTPATEEQIDMPNQAGCDLCVVHPLVPLSWHYLALD